MKIRTTYEVVTEESAAQGEAAERGWIDEDGEDFDNLDDAIDWLHDQGAIHPSASDWYRGVWYSTEPEQDTETGAYETRSFHLVDFDDDDAAEIFDEITGAD